MQTAEPHIASLLQLDRKMSSDSSKSEQSRKSRSFWPRVLLRFVLFCSCVMKYFESFEHLHWTQAAAVLNSQAGSVLMTWDLFVEESPKVARLDATKI